MWFFEVLFFQGARDSFAASAKTAFRRAAGGAKEFPESRPDHHRLECAMTLLDRCTKDAKYKPFRTLLQGLLTMTAI